MAYRQPARTAAARRPHSTVLVVGLGCLALILAASAFAGARHPLNDKGRVLNGDEPSHVPPVGWPRGGQAALVVGNSRSAASPHEQPAAIASLAKVMTAYLTLERYPLSDAQDGFTITVTAAQAQAAAQDAAQDQSVVAVRAGEQLTERQLLEALLIPSGNNIAQMLADLVAGSETRFLAEMNAEARTLGMSHTTYTDPSGFDPSTVSTAADQLRVFQRAMRFPVFRQIVSMASVTLPVAGRVTNYNPLLTEGYAGKTGSDSAAEGCLAFSTRVTVGGRRLTAVGVVMGQGEGSDTSVLLAAASEAAEQLVDSVTSAHAAGGDNGRDGGGFPPAPGAAATPPSSATPGGEPSGTFDRGVRIVAGRERRRRRRPRQSPRRASSQGRTGSTGWYRRFSVVVLPARPSEQRERHEQNAEAKD